MISQLTFTYDPKYKMKLFWANDVHLDSIFCKRDKFFEHCEMADKIILSGDFWDLMEGKFDKRAHKKDPDLQGHYINDLVKLGSKHLSKYKDKIIGWNKGNHELSFEKFSDVSITDFVCDNLGISPIKKGMHGYYIFKFRYKGHENKNGNSKVFYFTHNTGMNGRRSKGSLAADILAGERPSADIWIGEHSHRGVIVPLKVEHLSNSNTLKYKRKYFCQSLTYKAADEDKNGESFEINKGAGLLPTGGLFFDFYYNPKTKLIDMTVNITPE
jgi:hypothetical protein